EPCMKRVVCILLLAGLVVSVMPAQFVTMPPVVAKDARSMGMGGAFRVFSTGYSSFFGNPAGFASSGSLTFADMGIWAYVKPTMDKLDKVRELSQIQDESEFQQAVLNTAMDWYLENEGLGGGATLGGGWAGNGFAFGANVVTDWVPVGPSLMSSRLTPVLQANAVVGVANEARLGPFGFKLGVDGRIFYRVQAAGNGWGFDTLLSEYLQNGSFQFSSLTMLGGYGFAADAGVVLSIGPLMVGFAARDIGMAFALEPFTAQDLADYGFSALPITGESRYTLTPRYAAGIGIRLFENSLFEPSAYAEVDEPFVLLRSATPAQDVWNYLHAGAELRLLKFVTGRAGFNKGWISLGAGIDLALLEIDAAIFTEEVGLYAGERGRSGLSLQASLKIGR
ncbi:MAG: hypothetical protein QHH01_04505, partial [Spirochaetales bacterium]|nr:hypothetical protein [Spirochaetales bacterium]